MANAVYHTNLFTSLFRICIGSDNEPNALKDYHSDLGWDAITLSRAKEGDVYLWAWRAWGTHMVRVEESNWRNVIGMLKHNSIPSTNWWVLRVQKTTENGCCAGTIEWIGKDEREELIEYVRGILVDQIKADIVGPGH